MASLNSILSGLHLAKGVSPLGRGVAGLPGRSAEQSGIRTEDTFTQGEEWKNRAKAKDSAIGYGPGFTQAQAQRISAQNLPGAKAQGVESAPNQIEATEPGNPRVEDKEQKDGVQGAVAQESTEGQSSSTEANPAAATKPNGEPLTEPEKLLLAELQSADQQVRIHEMAHLSAAGGYAKGGATFSYQQGPDGKRYAVGGEVQIDIGKEASPDQTISKMRIVRRAALAPADPSPQDQKVAAQATIFISEATQELRLQEKSTPVQDVVRQGGDETDEGELVQEQSRESEEGLFAAPVPVDWQNPPKSASPVLSGKMYFGAASSSAPHSFSSPPALDLMA